jgi:hypothetical protein
MAFCTVGWHIDDGTVSVADSSDDQRSDTSFVSLQDIEGSPQINLLAKKQPPPTYYTSVAVPPIPQSSELSQNTDVWTSGLILQGTDLPPPSQGPRVFQQTHPTPLMDQVVHDLEQNHIIRRQRVVNAFRCFLVAKPSGSARFIMDLSPWTRFYKNTSNEAMFCCRGHLSDTSFSTD